MGDFETNLKPVLLTTMPKAGTYLFAEILSEIGLSNRHLHLAKNFAENLLLNDDQVNKIAPSKARIPLKLSQALYTVQPGEFVFGHIARPLLRQNFLDRFKIIYLFRDHKQAMQAEFYWFREVRKDMDSSFNRGQELSSDQHFVKYLKLFGANLVRLFNFLDKWKFDDSVLKIDFDKFRSDSGYAIQSVIDIGFHVGIEIDVIRAQEILETCLNRDNKTKTQRDRSINLWTSEAEKIYARLLKKQKIYNVIYPLYWSVRGLIRKFFNNLGFVGRS